MFIKNNLAFKNFEKSVLEKETTLYIIHLKLMYNVSTH